MKIIHYKRWKLQVEVEATRNAYNKVSLGGAEECSCLACQNFVAVKEQAYPQEILALFNDLGIDYKKEVEVWHNEKLESGLHIYNGWLHFIGYIVPEKDTNVLLSQINENKSKTDIYEFDTQRVNDTFHVGFTQGSGFYHYHNSFKDYPLVQIEFFIELPWVLDRLPEEE